MRSQNNGNNNNNNTHSPSRASWMQQKSALSKPAHSLSSHPRKFNADQFKV